MREAEAAERLSDLCCWYSLWVFGRWGDLTSVGGGACWWRNVGRKWKWSLGEASTGLAEAGYQRKNIGNADKSAGRWLQWKTSKYKHCAARQKKRSSERLIERISRRNYEKLENLWLKTLQEENHCWQSEELKENRLRQQRISRQPQWPQLCNQAQLLFV